MNTKSRNHTTGSVVAGAREFGKAETIADHLGVCPRTLGGIVEITFFDESLIREQL